MRRIKHFIDGSQVEPAEIAWLPVVEPATGQVYAELADGSAADVQRAVDAAERAFDQWSSTPAQQRADVMLRVADEIEVRLEEFARAESIDNGKPLALARTVDIPRAVANFRFFATSILHTHTQAHEMDGQALNYTLRQPIGVVGLISPWNLPLYLLSWKIAPAMAMGNTCVAKPSEVTPMTAFMLGEVFDQVDLPPGVVNIVHGFGGRAGAAIVEHPHVKAVSFTGGSATGAAIAATAAPKFKKLSLELGGKNPNIIFADANLDAAVKTTMRSSFANQGQICLCGSRILVERSAYDGFLSRFIECASQLRCGDPLEEGTKQGAVVSREHRDKILSYIDLARSEGGTVECGGSAPDASAMPERCRDGFFVEPTVVTGLDMQCRTNQEEVFGPFVTFTPFDGDDEAVAAANATQYGLSASIWTSNVQRAHAVASRIDAGTVWINCWLVRDLRAPFGGMKSSGVGREGGEEAMRFFTEPKNVCLGLV